MTLSFKEEPPNPCTQQHLLLPQLLALFSVVQDRSLVAAGDLQQRLMSGLECQGTYVLCEVISDTVSYQFN